MLHYFKVVAEKFYFWLVLENNRQFVMFLTVSLASYAINWWLRQIVEGAKVVVDTVKRIRQAIRRRRGNALIDKARELGPIVYYNYNEKKSLYAFCKKDNFISAVTDRLVSLGITEAFGRIKVQQTWVCCTNETNRMPIHLSISERKLREIQEQHVCKIFEIRKDDMDLGSFNTAVNILFRRDSRLYIPFKPESRPEVLADELRLFPLHLYLTSVEQLKEQLFN
jgi:hypothetical protein